MEPAAGGAAVGRESHPPGAVLTGRSRCHFKVWAPGRNSVEVHFTGPRERTSALKPSADGYFEGTVEKVSAGEFYKYRLDGKLERPDPASRFQPDGVHGPSAVVDHAFPWRDGKWGGVLPEKYVIYELHAGTFTHQGTFEGAIARLDYLAELGITAVELMPVAQFPGNRNWGYDGVYPYAVQESYGGPEGLKRFVDACHARGMAVVLDVVYNHLGPEGNYLRDFGPYFTDRYRTPWGEAVNFDGPFSDEVREYFIRNALAWFCDYHVDALRIDAIHAIYDFSAVPFLQDLGRRVREASEELGRRLYLFAESDLNDVRAVMPAEEGGLGLDVVWNDDYHHCVHTLMTGEKDGYYADFGGAARMAEAIKDGYVYGDRYSVHRKRRHGSSSSRVTGDRMVVFSQNHDQVGNRMTGERLSILAGFEKAKLAAALTLLSPYIPLLFMGEEYWEKAPFQYFVSHSDKSLVEAVRRGRKAEFSSFLWKGDPPDPQALSTFERSRLDANLAETGSHRVMRDFYSALISMRKGYPALSALSKEDMEVSVLEHERIIAVLRWNGTDQVLALFNVSDRRAAAGAGAWSGTWRKILDSAEKKWGGPGSGAPEEWDAGAVSKVLVPPEAAVVYHKTGAGEAGGAAV